MFKRIYLFQFLLYNICIIDDLLVLDDLGVDTDGDEIQDEDALSTWTMTALVTGGYHPVPWGTYLDIYQKKEIGL